MNEQKEQYRVDLIQLYAYSTVEEEKKDLEKAEQTLRKFLLDNSDSVRLTVSTAKTLRFNWNRLFYWEKRGAEENQKFSEIMERLRGDLLKKIENKERYQIEQPGKAVFQYLLYRLSTDMKELINKETLNWYMYEDSTLYSLEDPTFYTGDKLIGYVISHESEVFLNLSLQEKEALEKEGVKLESLVL